ncbi:MAG: hypothetical protein ACYC1K_03500 [Minisyncoccota bacterium]
MKPLILFLAIMLPHNISTAGELYIDINGKAWHDNKTYRYEKQTFNYNENNLGLGLTYSIHKYIEISTGYYYNSFRRNTLYGAAKLKYDIKYKAFTITPGLGLGLVTGYEDTPVKADIIQPVVIPVLRIVYEKVGLTIGYLPKTERQTAKNFSTSALTVQLNLQAN